MNNEEIELTEQLIIRIVIIKFWIVWMNLFNMSDSYYELRKEYQILDYTELEFKIEFVIQRIKPETTN